MRRTWAALRRQQQRELATWGKSTVAKAEASPVLHSAQTASIGIDLGVAVSDSVELAAGWRGLQHARRHRDHRRRHDYRALGTGITGQPANPAQW